MDTIESIQENIKNIDLTELELSNKDKEALKALNDRIGAYLVG